MKCSFEMTKFGIVMFQLLPLAVKCGVISIARLISRRRLGSEWWMVDVSCEME